jgi:uncharacterized protein YecE (DUF72 family)
MGQIRVGVSGWDYDHWEGGFYPTDLSDRERLPFAADRFATVEANGPFYSLLSPSSYARWYERTPSHFRFAVKGGRFITHNKKLGDAETALANFFASGVFALGDKLGPVLWQLSSRHSFDARRLAEFLDLLPRDLEQAATLARRHDHRVKEPLVEIRDNHLLHHVVEVRNDSFFCPEAVRLLRDHGVALAFSHAGDWPMREEITAGFVYVRLHGAPETYASGYEPACLERFAERIRAWKEGGEPDDALRITDLNPPARKERDVWVYLDNDASSRAPADARTLLDRLNGA